MTAARSPQLPAWSRLGLDPAAFSVLRFEQLPATPSAGLLALSLCMPREMPARARPALVVEREEVELIYVPRFASCSRLAPAQDDWLWRGVFPVPRELSADPGS